MPTNVKGDNMKTLHTVKQQKEFLAANHALATIEHKWSCRGYGNSKIFSGSGDQLAKRTGCGYDRFGAALGDAIQAIFSAEVYKLAKRTRNTKADRKNYQPSTKFYGLFYDAVKDKAWLDGACGSEQMIRILNAIGYDLQYVAKCEQSNTGSTFYTLQPVPRYKLEWL